MQLSNLFVTAFALLASHVYAQTGSQGVDTGNKLCTGACLPKSSELPCSKPEVSTSLMLGIRPSLTVMTVASTIGLLHVLPR